MKTEGGIGMWCYKHNKWFSGREMKNHPEYEEWLEQEMQHYRFHHIFWCRWDENNRWYSPAQWIPNFWMWFAETAEYRYDCEGFRWKIVLFVWEIQHFIDDCLTILEWDRPPHAENRGLFKGDWETKWGFWEYVYCRTIQRPLDRLHFWFQERVLGKEPVDDHLGCYSWPNCDIDPNGCTVLNGADAEPYGHRD